MREAGLEPARPEWTLEPESSESANSTTRAFAVFRLLRYIITDPPTCQADFSFSCLFFALFLPRNNALPKALPHELHIHYSEDGISKIGSLLAKTADFVFSLHYRSTRWLAGTMKPTENVYKKALISQGFQKQRTPLFDKIV